MITLRALVLPFACLSLWHPLGAQDLSAYRVPSMSMQPTLQIGDVLVYRTLPATGTSVAPDLERGDIVVFHGVPADESQLVIAKRIVGIPGDTLRMEAGRLQRNGHWIEEPYASHIAPAETDPADLVAQMRAWQLTHFAGRPPQSYAPTRNQWGPVVVPPAAVFVLGDNRDRSFDSRYFGAVPAVNLIGLVMQVRDSAQLQVRWTRSTPANQ